MDVIKEKISQKELDLKAQSDKQRFEREQNIAVPYHKPRQFTLQEFLSRKSLKKPTLEKGQKPRSAILELKKINENIEAFAQKMKEREEEAIEFFRSESESEGEEPGEDKENVSVNPIVVAAPESVPAEQVVEPAAAEISEVLSEEPPEVPEKSPEDLELDRLREKYETEKPSEGENKPEPEPAPPAPMIKTLKTIQEMGSKDFVIDLDSGTIVPKKLTGPELLFQKYLKSVQKPKLKEKVCVNILSVENGKIENKQVEVKLDKQFETDHSRPGEARGKFKDALWRTIETKRNEDMKLMASQMKEVEYEPEDKPEVEEAGEVEGDEVEVEEEVDDEEEEDEEVDTEEVKKKKSKRDGSAFIDGEVRIFRVATSDQFV